MSRSGQPLPAFGIDRFKVKHLANGLAIFVVLFLAGWLYPYVEAYFHLESYQTHGTFNNLVPAFWLTLIPAVLFEEVMYRSYLLTQLQNLGWKPGSALLFSSVLFMSYHIYQGPAVLPNIFLMGIVLGLTFFKLKSIWPGFIGHLLYDSLTFGYMFAWQVAHHR